MTTPTISSGVGQAELDAARLLLARMGISPAELLQGTPARPPAPTFAEYVPVVAKTVSDASRRAYSSYWKRTVEQRGERRLDEPTPSEVKELGEYVRANVVVRSNARGGRSAVENFITALRCLYNQAVADGLINEADNPSRKVSKPRRVKSTRRAVPDARLAEINQVAATTGNDSALDTLLLRLHIETACRRGGALALRPVDLGGCGSGRPVTGSAPRRRSTWPRWPTRSARSAAARRSTARWARSSGRGRSAATVHRGSVLRRGSGPASPPRLAIGLGRPRVSIGLPTASAAPDASARPDRSGRGLRAATAAHRALRRPATATAPGRRRTPARTRRPRQRRNLDRDRRGIAAKPPPAATATTTTVDCGRCRRTPPRPGHGRRPGPRQRTAATGATKPVPGTPPSTPAHRTRTATHPLRPACACATAPPAAAA